MSARAPGAHPASVRIWLSGLLIWLGFFAGWSAGSIPLTLAGAPFWALSLAGLTGLAGAIGAWWLRGRVMCVLGQPLLDGGQFVLPRSWARYALTGATGLGLAVAALWFIKTSDARLLWAVTLACTALSLILQSEPAETATPAPEAPAPLSGATVGLLALVLIGLYLIILRPDGDDAFYLNLPIGLKATGAAGMMTGETMYGTAGWPLLGSNYRVEALPTLTAALSWVTGLSVLTVAHTVLPLVWCLAYAAALFLIGVALFGRAWPLFAVLALLIGLALAGSLQTWGTHGLVRFFHGKGPLICIVIPLIVFLTLPGIRAQLSFRPVLVLLCGLQVAALGLTANAIYIAPLALGLALFAGLFPLGREAFRSLPLLIAALPPLLAGVYLLLFDPPFALAEEFHNVNFNAMAIWQMFIAKYLIGTLAAALFAGAGAAVLVRGGTWASWYLLGCLVFVFNPLLWPYYDRIVTGGLNFRLYWAVPLPLFLAAIATWAVMRRGAVVQGASIAAALALALSPAGIFLMEGTSIALSPHKVPAQEFALARKLDRLASPQQTVLAPEAIAQWIATSENHARPIYTRLDYLSQVKMAADSEQLERRLRLARWINDPDSTSAPQEDLQAVCVSVIFMQREGAGEILNSLGYAAVDTQNSTNFYKSTHTCN